MSSVTPPEQDIAEITYRTQLVIYNFLRLVPSSIPPSPVGGDVPDFVGPATGPLPFPNGNSTGVHQSNGLQGNVCLHNDGLLSDAERKWVPDRRKMFDELKARMATREPQSAHRESLLHKTILTRQMINELMAKVEERERRVANTAGEKPPLAPPTIIKKRSTIKVLMEPISPPPPPPPPPPAPPAPSTLAPPPPPLARSDGRRHSGLPPLTGGLSAVFSPIGIPQCTSTPSMISPSMTSSTTTLSSSAKKCVLAPAADDDDMSSGPEGSSTPERALSVISEAGSMYLDIEQFDDVTELVKTGVLPPVTLSLRREISQGMNELRRSMSRQTSECEDEFDGSRSVLSLSGSLLSDSAPKCLGDPVTKNVLAPSRVEVEAAEYMRAMGDQLQARYGGVLDNIVTNVRHLPRHEMLDESGRMFDELFQNVADKMVRVALILMFCQRLIYALLSSGIKGIQDIVECMAKLIQNKAANVVLKSGGWHSAADLEVIELADEELLANAEQSTVPQGATVGSGDGDASHLTVAIQPVDVIDGAERPDLPVLTTKHQSSLAAEPPSSGATIKPNADSTRGSSGWPASPSSTNSTVGGLRHWVQWSESLSRTYSLMGLAAAVLAISSFVVWQRLRQ